MVRALSAGKEVIHMINKLFTFDGLPVESKQEEKRGKALPLNLQFFADPGDNPEGGSGDEDIPNLDKLLENPKFKEQYESKFKAGMDERFKKYKGVDVEEYNRLKVEAEKQQPNAETKKPENQTADNDPKKQQIPDEVTKQLELSERRLKVAAMKEFSADAELNAEQRGLFTSLVNIKDVELNDDGEATNLKEIFEELSGKFPGTFAAAADTPDEPTQQNGLYKPGSTKQKTNEKTKVDPAARGLELAKRLYPKKED